MNRRKFIQGIGAALVALNLSLIPETPGILFYMPPLMFAPSKPVWLIDVGMVKPPQYTAYTLEHIRLWRSLPQGPHTLLTSKPFRGATQSTVVDFLQET